MKTKKIIEALEKAIELVETNSKGNATEKAWQAIYILEDDLKEYGHLDKENIDIVKKEIVNAAEYAGFTNIQYDLLKKVRKILENI